MECQNDMDPFRPVDAIYAGPILSSQDRITVTQTFGQLTRLFIPESEDTASALDSYFADHNRGRPFILLGNRTSEYLDDHPELGDRLVSTYAMDIISSESASNDIQTAISSFIRTRTYCLRDRVDESMNE